VAERLEVATGTVAGWETGSHAPRKRHLKAVAKLLRLDYDAIVAEMFA
jgi:transcriptional regulator with XRE-family HTH domain